MSSVFASFLKATQLTTYYIWKNTLNSIPFVCTNASRECWILEWTFSDCRHYSNTFLCSKEWSPIFMLCLNQPSVVQSEGILLQHWFVTFCSSKIKQFTEIIQYLPQMMPKWWDWCVPFITDKKRGVFLFSAEIRFRMNGNNTFAQVKVLKGHICVCRDVTLSWWIFITVLFCSKKYLHGRSCLWNVTLQFECVFNWLCSLQGLKKYLENLIQIKNDKNYTFCGVLLVFSNLNILDI